MSQSSVCVCMCVRARLRVSSLLTATARRLNAAFSPLQRPAALPNQHDLADLMNNELGRISSVSRQTDRHHCC